MAFGMKLTSLSSAAANRSVVGESPSLLETSNFGRDEIVLESCLEGFACCAIDSELDAITAWRIMSLRIHVHAIHLILGLRRFEDVHANSAGDIGSHHYVPTLPVCGGPGCSYAFSHGLLQHAS